MFQSIHDVACFAIICELTTLNGTKCKPKSSSYFKNYQLHERNFTSVIFALKHLKESQLGTFSSKVRFSIYKSRFCPLLDYFDPLGVNCNDNKICGEPGPLPCFVLTLANDVCAYETSILQMQRADYCWEKRIPCYLSRSLYVIHDALYSFTINSIKSCIHVPHGS